MKFTPGSLYHIYNRGNNKQPIFIEKRNFEFFQSKIRKHLIEYSDVICYCLMPNHFHLLVQIKENNIQNELNTEIGILLRSYTRAINVQEGNTGSLFQQKTKAIDVTSHFFVCFNYIHQNPLKAGLTDKLDGWEYSSFNEYTGRASNPMCNIELGKKLIDFKNLNEFYNFSCQNIDQEQKDKLF